MDNAYPSILRLRSYHLAPTCSERRWLPLDYKNVGGFSCFDMNSWFQYTVRDARTLISSQTQPLQPVWGNRKKPILESHAPPRNFSMAIDLRSCYAPIEIRWTLVLSVFPFKEKKWKQICNGTMIYSYSRELKCKFFRDSSTITMGNYT